MATVATQAPDPQTVSETDSLSKLTKDLKQAAATLTTDQVRFLVSNYYRMQSNRTISGGQAVALAKNGEPNEVLLWFNTNSEFLEKQLRAVLLKYSESYQLGRWCMSNYGIGPVITAGLLAHIDIEKAPTVGHIWSYAGVNPTQLWAKGQKRPWNADLKVLVWKIGESFAACKQYIEDGAFYSKLTFDRWEYEKANNAAGKYAEKAKAVSAARPTHKQAATYSAGTIPDGHIWARAKRYGAKMFLSHFHAVAYELKNGKQPPRPYAIEFGGHVHLIKPPNWPLDPKFGHLPKLPEASKLP